MVTSARGNSHQRFRLRARLEYRLSIYSFQCIRLRSQIESAADMLPRGAAHANSERVISQ
jgi:hypothetical protein